MSPMWACLCALKKKWSKKETCQDMKLSFMFCGTKNTQLTSFWNESLVDRLIIIITQNFVTTMMLTDAVVRY